MIPADVTDARSGTEGAGSHQGAESGLPKTASLIACVSLVCGPLAADFINTATVTAKHTIHVLKNLDQAENGLPDGAGEEAPLAGRREGVGANSGQRALAQDPQRSGVPAR